MHWIQHLAGVETGHLLLLDRQPEVEDLFGVMHDAMCRRLEIIADRSPYPAIYSVENTSTTLISPRMFRRHCQPHLADYGHLIRQADKRHILHMCGKLKLLLPDVATLPATAIEAFTSPPVGNTTLLDGRRDCPDMCLIGGTNATLWLQPAEQIIEAIEAHLDDLPHQRGIVITSAGVMPPPCRPETIKRVADWVKTYSLAA
jgi:uroporphyrinogen-III decarboxylase